MSASTLTSKPASIWAARASSTCLPKRRARMQMSAKSHAAARSNKARSLFPASSSGASVGPAGVAEAGGLVARSPLGRSGPPLSALRLLDCPGSPGKGRVPPGG
jgi:hypothetical protein